MRNELAFPIMEILTGTANHCDCRSYMLARMLRMFSVNASVQGLFAKA